MVQSAVDGYNVCILLTDKQDQEKRILAGTNHILKVTPARQHLTLRRNAGHDAQ